MLLLFLDVGLGFWVIRFFLFWLLIFRYSVFFVVKGGRVKGWGWVGVGGGVVVEVGDGSVWVRGVGSFLGLVGVVFVDFIVVVLLEGKEGGYIFFKFRLCIRLRVWLCLKGSKERKRKFS